MAAASSSPTSLAGTIFRALADTRWRFLRRVRGRPQSVDAEGDATFAADDEAAAAASSGAVTERRRVLLYSESGRMRFLPGPGGATADASTAAAWFPITARYRYALDTQLDTQLDTLSVHFVDEAEPGLVGRLFHRVEFAESAAAPASSPGRRSTAPASPGVVAASGSHLCSADHYLAAYRFCFQGGQLASVEVTYTVTGPAKDYVSSTQFKPA